MGLTFAMVGGMWLIGHFAIRPLDNQGGLQAVQRSPANGFEAWNELPEGGLHPAPAMGRLVSTIGRPLPAPIEVLLALAFVAASLAAGATFLAHDWLAAHYPTLSSSETAWTTFGLFVALMVGVHFQRWAAEARARLAVNTPL